MKSASLHSVSLPGPILRRGFWLYVWRVNVENRPNLHYVGRTGDNSSPHATAPYTRMGQHLGFQKTQNALRKHLIARSVQPEECVSFDLIAHGPIYAELPPSDEDRSARMAKHIPMRDQVGSMEKLLCDSLKTAGYDVMNTVNCRWQLDDVGLKLWADAKASFQKEFRKLV